jgi:hypothetical protein
MRSVPTMICDRCGCTEHYIEIKGSNGMVTWSADLCSKCYEDVKAMMLNANNRYRKRNDQ